MILTSFSVVRRDKFLACNWCLAQKPLNFFLCVTLCNPHVRFFFRWLSRNARASVECVQAHGLIFHMINVWLNNARVTDCLRSLFAARFSRRRRRRGFTYFFSNRLRLRRRPSEKRNNFFIFIISRKVQQNIYRDFKNRAEMEEAGELATIFRSSRGHDEHDFWYCGFISLYISVALSSPAPLALSLPARQIFMTAREWKNP